MKLSRTVAYAVQATVQLAGTPRGEPVPCSRLAARGRMPERFLLQILRTLVTKGILRSTRGVDGGYCLLRKPEEISLLEIIEAIDGPMSAGIPDGEGWPQQSEMKLREALSGVAAHARRDLAAIKLAHLIPSAGG